MVLDMVQQTHGNSGKYLNNEWHRVRWHAETQTYKIEEWSEIEITKYDLEDVDFSRKYKDSTYITDSRIDEEGGSKSGIDIRKFPQRE